MHAPTEENTHDHKQQMNMVFANHIEEDVIYPLTVKETAHTQKNDKHLEKLQQHDKYTNQLIEDTQLLCKDGRMVSPKSLQH